MPPVFLSSASGGQKAAPGGKSAPHTAAFLPHPSTRAVFEDDYEARFPEDEYCEETTPNARVWRVYSEEAANFDGNMMREYRDVLDVMLVFAGLFCAVVATLLVQVSINLRADFVEMSAVLLYDLVVVQLSVSPDASLPNITIPSVDPRASFTPDSLDLVVNAFWGVSLTLSLIVASTAVLVKQWLHHYMSRPSGTPAMRSHLRQFRFEGLERWRVGVIIGVLPILMNISLALFLVGLTMFYVPLSKPIASIIGVLTCAIVVVYLVTNIIPCFAIQCPYQTPMSDFVRLFGKFILGFVLLGRIAKRMQALHRFALSERKSLRELEIHVVKESYDTSSVDTLSELFRMSSNPNVQSVVIQAIGGLPLASLDHAEAVLFSEDSEVLHYFRTKEFPRLFVLPGDDTRLERLCRPAIIWHKHVAKSAGPLFDTQEYRLRALVLVSETSHALYEKKEDRFKEFICAHYEKPLPPAVWSLLISKAVESPSTDTSLNARFLAILLPLMNPNKHHPDNDTIRFTVLSANDHIWDVKNHPRDPRNHGFVAMTLRTHICLAPAPVVARYLDGLDSLFAACYLRAHSTNRPLLEPSWDRLAGDRARAQLLLKEQKGAHTVDLDNYLLSGLHQTIVLRIGPIIVQFFVAVNDSDSSLNVAHFSSHCRELELFTTVLNEMTAAAPSSSSSNFIPLVHHDAPLARRHFLSQLHSWMLLLINSPLCQYNHPHRTEIPEPVHHSLTGFLSRVLDLHHWLTRSSHSSRNISHFTFGNIARDCSPFLSPTSTRIRVSRVIESTKPHAWVFHRLPQYLVRVTVASVVNGLELGHRDAMWTVVHAWVPQFFHTWLTEDYNGWHLPFDPYHPLRANMICRILIKFVTALSLMEVKDSRNELLDALLEPATLLAAILPNVAYDHDGRLSFIFPLALYNLSKQHQSWRTCHVYLQDVVRWMESDQTEPMPDFFGKRQLHSEPTLVHDALRLCLLHRPGFLDIVKAHIVNLNRIQASDNGVAAANLKKTWLSQATVPFSDLAPSTDYISTSLPDVFPAEPRVVLTPPEMTETRSTDGTLDINAPPVPEATEENGKCSNYLLSL